MSFFKQYGTVLELFDVPLMWLESYTLQRGLAKLTLLHQSIYIPFFIPLFVILLKPAGWNEVNNVPADRDRKLYTAFQNITGISTKVHIFLKPELCMYL